MINLFINKVFAANPSGGSGGGITNPLNNVKTIQELIGKILNLVVQIGLPIIVLMIIYAGFKYVTARGNPEKIKEAHDAILWTVIGAAVVLGAAVISHAISGTITSLGGGGEIQPPGGS